MIEFKINDKKYSLEWMYEGSNITSKLTKKWIQPQVKTTCFLKDENHNILATGYTIKHKGDNNCKEIARKYSLKKMLSNYYGIHTPEWVFMESYVYPEKYFTKYAAILMIDVDILKKVGELCEKYDQTKEVCTIAHPEIQV